MSYIVNKDGQLTFKGYIVLGFLTSMTMDQLIFFVEENKQYDAIKPRLLINELTNLYLQLRWTLEEYNRSSLLFEKLALLQNEKEDQQYLLQTTRSNKIYFTYYSNSKHDLDILCKLFLAYGYKSLIMIEV